jgi:hypothetical protein
VTSLGSTSDDTQTWPSIDADAMYIWFEGIAGTWASRGVRGEGVWAAGEAVRLAEASGRSEGGTKGCDDSSGDTDSAVTEADL